MKRLSLARAVIAVITISATLLTAASCGETGFSTFNIKEGVQHFTLEYPSEYRLGRIDMSDTADSQYTTVGFTSSSAGAYSEFYVYVWPATQDLSTGPAVLETLLTNAQGVLTSFTLGTKSEVTVNNETANSAAFTAVQTDSTTGDPLGPAYYRVSCFVHDVWIVEIDMTCDLSLKDATQGYYDHLLQTFALLD